MTAAPREAELPELSVRNFAACEVGKGLRLVGAPVEASTVYLVLAGTMHLRLPGHKLTATAGSLVLVPPDHPPAIAPGATATSEVIATRNCLIQRGGLLVFDAAEGGRGDLRVLVGRVAGDLDAALGRATGDPTPAIAALDRFALARSIYAALLAEIDDPRPGLAAFSASLMTACLLLFVRGTRDASDAPAPASLPTGNRLAGVVAAILARPSGRHNLALLAEQAGMSRATFARRFAEATGTTPMEFVQRARLHEAAALLRTTDMPVKQVAAEAGFASRSHFSRSFIETFGASPTDYRAGQSEAPMIVDAPEATPSLFEPVD